MTEKELLQMLSDWHKIHLLKHQALEDEQLLQMLATLALENKSKESWRTAWILDKVDEKKPALTDQYIHLIISQLEKEKNHSKKRHFLRMIGNHLIEKKHHGKLFNTCLSIFEDNKEPIASRSFALQVLYNIAKVEIDLQDELRSLIHFELEQNPSPGIKSRCKNILKKLT